MLCRLLAETGLNVWQQIWKQTIIREHQPEINIIRHCLVRRAYVSDEKVYYHKAINYIGLAQRL